jgi:hypothetical protein
LIILAGVGDAYATGEDDFIEDLNFFGEACPTGEDDFNEDLDFFAEAKYFIDGAALKELTQDLQDIYLKIKFLFFPKEFQTNLMVIVRNKLNVLFVYKFKVKKMSLIWYTGFGSNSNGKF